MREILARLTVATAAVIGIGLPASLATAGETPGVVVLDTLGVWRFHSQLAPPVLETGEKLPFSCRWMAFETPAAAPDRMKPDFDDRFWHRGPLTLVPKTALLARACATGEVHRDRPGGGQGIAALGDVQWRTRRVLERQGTAPRAHHGG